MTAHNDLDRQLNEFLRDGPTELPYQSFDAVRDRTEETGQRVVIGPWRLPEMTRIVTIGLAAAAVVVAVFVGAQFLGSPSVGGGSDDTPTPQPTSTLEPTATPDPSPTAGSVQHLLVDRTGSDPVAITVTMAAPDWDGSPGGGYVQRREQGADPPDGAGVLGYAEGEYYVYADPCAWSTTRPESPATTVDELVDALANQSSREPSAPEDITVDGYAGQKIILHMAGDVDMDACEDEFPLFGVPGDDLARYSQGPGQIEELWILDVDGLIVVLDGVYYPDTMPSVVDEVRAILASATFELP